MIWIWMSLFHVCIGLRSGVILSMQMSEYCPSNTISIRRTTLELAAIRVCWNDNDWIKGKLEETRPEWHFLHVFVDMTLRVDGDSWGNDTEQRAFTLESRNQLLACTYSFPEGFHNWLKFSPISMTIALKIIRTYEILNRMQVFT